MCPIKVFVDEKEVAVLGPDWSQCFLPNPPGGVVTWTGDKRGEVSINSGPNASISSFSLTTPGDSVTIETSLCFGRIGPLAINKTYRIGIQRI